MIAVSFYLLVTLSQASGIDAEAFGNFTECMTTLSEMDKDDRFLALNRCDEIKLYPAGSPLKGEDVSNGTDRQ